STKPLATLTAELWDFLGLGPDLGLPELDRVSISRSVRQGGWSADAYTSSQDAAAAIDAIYAYAAYAGSEVRRWPPYRSPQMQSDWQMHLSTRIVVAEVTVHVHAPLDADAYAEAMAADRETVHVVGET